MNRSLKMMTRVLSAATFLVLFALAANAQCDIEQSNTAYKKFTDNYKGSFEQKNLANDVGKEYLAKFGECPEEGQKTIAAFVRKWLDKFATELPELTCLNAVDKTPTQAVQLCEPYLAKDRNDLRSYLLIASAGTKVGPKGDTKFNNDTINASRKALELIAAGKTVDNWIVGRNQQEAIGALNYYIGFFTIDSSPSDGAASLVKAIRSSDIYSNDPAIYRSLGRAYDIQVKKLVSDYNTNCVDKDPTPSECDASFKRAEEMIDRAIDAYARLVALGKDKRDFASLIDAVRPDLLRLYKSRHENSVAGLDEFVTAVLSKPVP